MGPITERPYSGNSPWSGWTDHKGAEGGMFHINHRWLNGKQHALAAEWNEMDKDANHIHYILAGKIWIVASVKIDGRRWINRAKFLKKLNNLMGGRMFNPSMP